MTTTLVPMNKTAMLHDAPSALRMLSEARQWLEDSTDPDELYEAVQKAQLAREWVRIAKGAAEIGAEATRLEMVALRRLAEIGSFGSLSAGQKAAAKGFAAMTHAEFDSAIADVATSCTATGVWSRIKQERARQEGFDAGERIMNGGGASPSNVSRAELETAAKTILSASLGSEQSTSIATAALALA